MEFVPKVVRKFGFREEWEITPTFWMTAKKGMDDTGFENIIFEPFVPYYPDADDTRGKRVILKFDSGPRQLNLMLLAHLKLLEIVLYLSIPNTTPITQEIDQNYGPFNQQFKTNLEWIKQHRPNHKLTYLLQLWLLGLIVFGGCNH